MKHMYFSTIAFEWSRPTFYVILTQSQCSQYGSSFHKIEFGFYHIIMAHCEQIEEDSFTQTQDIDRYMYLFFTK